VSKAVYLMYNHQFNKSVRFNTWHYCCIKKIKLSYSKWYSNRL